MAEWWSQRFPPEGSAAADGIKKQLGQPSLDPLTVLVREAAQNSWDARAGSDVHFNIDLSRLGTAAEVWRSEFMRGVAQESGLFAGTAMTEETLVLTVSDRGTVGLGGPLRAGVRSGPDERPDFVQFLRNVGEPRDQSMGGGTYGFGKGIYYSISRASAILVDSHAVDRRSGRRLMGAAMTNKWASGDSVFTGRHWWGHIVDGVPDPLLDTEAESMAQALGLPGFEPDAHGTDIVIIDPELGMFDEERPRTLDEAMAYIRSAMYWNLWPKMVPGPQGVMQFSTSMDGGRRDLLAPSSIPALTPFISSLELARKGEGRRYTRKRHPYEVGTLALQLAPAQLLDFDGSPDARPFSGSMHHVARMRQVELVVDYFSGEEHPDPRFGYAGVFLASEDADEIFGRAEPPTHDEWVISGLTGSDYGVVNNLKAFLRNGIQDEIRPRTSTRSSGDTNGLGRLASRLGAVTRGFAGTGAGGGAQTGDSTGGPGAGRRSARPYYAEAPAIVTTARSAQIQALVAIPGSGAPRRVAADIVIVLDGGGVEGEPPIGSGVAEVVWRHPESGETVRSSFLDLEPGELAHWWVVVPLIEDAAVRLRVDWAGLDG